MSQTGKAAVPKFGSFKPRAVPGQGAAGDGSKASNDGERESRHIRKQLGERDRQRRVARHERRRSQSGNDRRPRRERQHKHERHASRDHGLTDRVRDDRRHRHEVTADEFEESDLFIVDRRGDAMNVEYGSLHRYSVPPHHRTGYGRVLGTVTSLKIDREASSDKHVVLSNPHGDSSNRSGRLLSSSKGQTARERNLRVVVPSAEDDIPETEADYVPLRASGSRKRKRGSQSPDMIPQREEVDYRSIEGKAKPTAEPDDEDLQVATDSDDDMQAGQVAQEVRQQNAALVRKTKEQPRDVDAWIALIEHQGRLVKPGADPNALSNNEKRTVANIRLSIYEQALRYATKGSAGHEQLLLGMMGQGSLLWETSKFKTKWTESLKDCPTSVPLWMRYLDFVQTSHVTFRFETCKTAYLQCLRLLREAQVAAGGSKRMAIGNAQVHVLIRLTAFLREAGHDELAYALWQAMLERHFFPPSDITDQQTLLASFESFWDSDEPRIGEASSKGWAAVHAGATSEVTRSSLPAQAPLRLDDTQPFLTLAEREMRLLDKLHLPAATDQDSDDPFRFVMFSDLREVLEAVQDVSETALLDAFLAFMYLPPLASFSAQQERKEWRTDQFLRPSRCDSVEGKQAYAALQHRPSTIWSLFHDAFSQSAQLHVAETVTLIDRVLDRLVSIRPDDEVLTEYYIAFKLHHQPPAAAKTAKKMLKARPSSLRLYNAYAMSEARTGQVVKAAEVFFIALKMSNGFSEDEQGNAVLLWHSWLLTTLQEDAGEAAGLQLMLRMCDVGPVGELGVSAAQRLKARQSFEAGWERMMYKRKYELAVLYAECHMGFAYLVEDKTLEPALEVRRKYSSRLSRLSIPSAEELLLQAQAGLIQMHIDRRRPYKPVVLRAELDANLRSFPNNSIVLECYVRLGSHTRIDDRIRASLHDDLLTGPKATVMGWSQAVADEVRRCASDYAGSTTNAVRSLFKRALLTPDSAAKHSVTLWKTWFEFESEHLVQQKQVFLDGLRYLPWSKAWVFMGLHAFASNGGMTQRELRQVYDVLGERELRTRLSVEELENALAAPHVP